jgi:hypothetical protein
MTAPMAANTARFVVDRLVRDRADLTARAFLRDKLEHAKEWHPKDLYSHYGCVNAIEFSSEGSLLVSGTCIIRTPFGVFNCWWLKILLASTHDYD